MARRKPRADWCFRGPIYTGAAGGFEQEGASYTSVFRSFTAGESISLILYDSQNYFHESVGVDPTETMSRAARAEGKRATTIQVKGFIGWEATTWSPGSNVYFGWRIGAFEQDASDGGILVPAGYTMFQGTAFPSSTPALYANMRMQNAWEHIIAYHFAAGNETSRRSMNIRVPAKRTLPPNYCLALYWELAPSSVDIRYTTYLQTLVSDEG